MSSGKNNKAKFIIEGDSEPLNVQFNPEQYTVKETVEYSQISSRGTDKDITQYVGHVKAVASISFHFESEYMFEGNAAEPRFTTDVSQLTAKFANLLRIDGNLHRPPYVTFIWGSISIRGFITSVATNFTMFDNQGVPVRAKIDCELLSVGGESAVKRSPLMSPDRTKSRVLTEDTDIWKLAALEYGDINRWRIIAKANKILDPINIPVGKVLKVPALV